MAVKEKHQHYYKNVAHLHDIDVYRVLERFGVTHPSIQHALKKLLVSGGRGCGKDQDQDVQEAIDSLKRFQEMRVEDAMEGLPQSYLAVGDGASESDAAFNKMLSKIPIPVASVAKRKETKRPARKAAKRPARRGR